MAQIIPIKIPTYISAADFAPARVLPRLFYYNGLIECESYYIESGSLTTSGVSKEQTAFPYFDNYNVVTGSFPTEGSDSLLFTNEAPAYGALPSGSLYTNYWQRYISLLYNPVTRLVQCEAIIPLADYFKMELNDIVQWRGNYYHLRAINDYNLSNGECNLQLLGPILDDIIPNIIPAIACDFDFSFGCDPTPTTTLTPTTLVPTTTIAPTTLVPTTIAPTTTPPVLCFAYQYGPAQSGCTINWTNCDGSAGSTFVPLGQFYNVPCMVENSGTGCGQWTKGAACITPTTTTAVPTTTLVPTTTTLTPTTTTLTPTTSTTTATPTVTPTTLTPTTAVPTTTAAPGVILYRYTRGGGYANPGFTYTDFNGNARQQETFTFGNNFVFAAISGSVVDVIGGGNIAVITNPYTPTFSTITVTKTSGNALTAYTGQDTNGQTQFISESPGGYTRTYCWVTPTPVDSYDTLNKITITTGGACTPPTTTLTPTTTTTPVTSFGGCGYGSSVAGACNDASANNRTLYSNCDGGTFGVGCFVYVDTFPNALTGYTNVFMNLASWDVNPSTGQVTAYSSEQC